MNIIKIIIIPGECVSKKRAIQPVKFGNHLSIGKTKIWKVYEKMALGVLSKIQPLSETIQYPVYIHIWHYRKTRRLFDYLNMAQGIHDVLQGNMKIHKDLRHSIIVEDNVNHVIPVHESPFSGWSVDKENARTVVTITDDPYYLIPKDLTNQGIIKMLEQYQLSMK